MEVLVINGHDWSYLIESRGYGFARNDLDGEETTRTKSGTMRRKKVAEKLTIPMKTLSVSREELAALNEDLSQQTFSATVRTINGTVTKEFYCSSFQTTLIGIFNGVEMWDGAEFTLVEV